ncbi:MAG: pilus assembly protein PilM [Patescibacteria group bacterium]|jgi:type IV pilus assembly protein PilM
MAKQSGIPRRPLLQINPFRNAIGIDISDLVVRAVQITGRPGNLKLHALSERHFSPGWMQNGEIQNDKKITAVLHDLLSKPWMGRFSGSYVTLSLPERQTFLKLIDIPKTREGDPTEVVRFEATNHIPMNLNDVYLDWEYVPGTKAEGKDKQRVLVAAAPRILVDSYLKLFEGIKFKPIACELESIALYRALAPALYEKGTSLVIDFGGSETLFMLANAKTVLFTSTISNGGDALTAAIEKKLGVSHTEAEKAKVLYGLEAKHGKGKIRSILLPLFKPYQEKLKEILNFYVDHFPTQDSLERVVLAGAGSRLKGLPAYIENILNLPVDIANPRGFLGTQRHDPFEKHDATPYAPAIGLALREHLHDNT